MYTFFSAFCLGQVYLVQNMRQLFHNQCYVTAMTGCNSKTMIFNVFLSSFLFFTYIELTFKIYHIDFLHIVLAIA